jgi:hypothetical protein
MSDPSPRSLAFSSAPAAETPSGLTVAVDEDAAAALAIAHFDRVDDAQAGKASLPVVRRDTGGKAVRVGPGILRIVVQFPMDGNFVPDAARILNRAVRPLLRALRSVTPLVHYFGRDVVSGRVAGVRQELAVVGFAHDGAQGRGIFEAVLSTQPGLTPRADVISLADALGPTNPGWEATLSEAISRSYEKEGARRVPLEPLESATLTSPATGPTDGWDHVDHFDPVGMRVGVSTTSLAIGGDFFVSTDWFERLRQKLAALPRPTDEATLRALVEDDPPEANGGVLLGIEGPHVLTEALVTALARAGEFRDQTTL